MQKLIKSVPRTPKKKKDKNEILKDFVIIFQLSMSTLF